MNGGSAVVDSRTIEILRRRLKTEPSKDMKVLIIRVLGCIGKEPIIDSTLIVEDLINLLAEKSTKIRVQIIQSLEMIGKTKFQYNARFVAIATQFLNSQYTMEMSADPIKRVCLKLLGSLVPIDRDPQSDEALISMITSYFTDRDARVRTKAVSAIVQFIQRGGIVLPKMYQPIKKVLIDSCIQVRLAGLKLVWLMAQQHPEYVVNHSGSTNRLRLVDDAFTRTCVAVTDTSMAVRTLGASLLGTFQGVQTNYLLLTFGKEILSGANKGSLSLSRGKAPSGSEAKPEDILITDDALMDTGAIGVFIQGLEDEFFEVREATVESIGELSMRSLDFAQKAVDFLVDMFNDEIESVVVNAINCLKKLGNRVRLTEDQLHIVLSTVQDSSSHVRVSLHQLLKTTVMTSITCLHATTSALLANLTRYPKDVDTTFEALKSLGERHSSYTEFIIEDLLRIDSRFLTQEYHPDDVYFIGVLIVILNASTINKSILALLPKYIFRHTHYLKDKYPSYFPDVKISEEGSHHIGSMTSDMDVTDVTEVDVGAFLEQIVDRFGKFPEFLKSRNFSEARRMIISNQRQLERVMELDKRLKDNAQFYHIYAKILQIFVEFQDEDKLSRGNSWDDGKTQRNFLSSRLMILSYRLENLFLGITAALKLELVELRIVADLVMFLDTMALHREETQIDPTLLLQQFRDRLFLARSFCSENSLKYPENLENLDRACHTLTPSEISQNIPTLLKMITTFIPNPIKIKNLLKKSHGQIIYPATNPDKPAEFLLNFPVKIEFQARLYNVDDISMVIVQVELPDGSVQNFPLTPVNCVSRQPLQHHLEEDLLVDLKGITGIQLEFKLKNKFKLKIQVETYVEMNIAKFKV
eukprot:TRINITY_DN5496_c0_g1_i3.p1 TRINITY_DN5496_c0_g1~~TRINITY_DN5496_c0_g1_i3.p1  ORF type:complete len:936 (-),score=298.92 TRINITY_DN5496_c0_g1_i3:291-2894(-)